MASLCGESLHELHVAAKTFISPKFACKLSYKMASSPSSTAQAPVPESVPKLIPKENRYPYGLSRMEVLASTNPTDSCLYDYARFPTTFSARKKIGTVSNSEFALVYEDKIHDAIVKALQSSLPEKCQWAVHVLRMGFSTNQMNNPIVIHILVPYGYLSDNEAYALLLQIAAILSASQWKSELVYVDVCQRVNPVYLRADDDRKGIDISEIFARLYAYDHPLPGFSIGPMKAPGLAGTFSGFIKHQNKTYGLTCEHVVNGRDSTVLGSPHAYKYKEGAERFMLTIPAIMDHETTRDAISTRFGDTAKYGHIESMAKVKAIWETAKEQADKHNIEIGHVYATSGCDKSQKYFSGCLDWAIFQYPFEDARSQHSEYSGADDGSGFQLKSAPRLFVDKHLNNPEFTRDAVEYFRFGANFKPYRDSDVQPDEIFFKVPSRTSGWREARCVGIMATLNAKDRGLTRELCFVTSSQEYVSAPGDSGAPLIDSSFRPVAILWGGEEQQHPEIGMKDVTYATPIRDILKDIERRLEWQPGSATYC